MVDEKPKGPFCQSCGMPLERPEQFGTSAEGFRVNEYCGYCYRDGRFTEPDITVEGMIDKCVAIMVQQGVMGAEHARELMTELIPDLKRWRAPR